MLAVGLVWSPPRSAPRHSPHHGCRSEHAVAIGIEEPIPPHHGLAPHGRVAPDDGVPQTTVLPHTTVFPQTSAPDRKVLVHARCPRPRYCPTPRSATSQRLPAMTDEGVTGPSSHHDPAAAPGSMFAASRTAPLAVQAPRPLRQRISIRQGQGGVFENCLDRIRRQVRRASAGWRRSSAPPRRS